MSSSIELKFPAIFQISGKDQHDGGGRHAHDERIGGFYDIY
jgi:hypothetical protein